MFSLKKCLMILCKNNQDKIDHTFENTVLPYVVFKAVSGPQTRILVWLRDCRERSPCAVR